MRKKLLKSLSSVSLMTLISRVLGFIRDAIAAQIFGINAGVDAFYIAFKIPNFLRNLFAEGSFSQAFVPVLSDYREKKTPTEVKQFIQHMSFSLGLAVLITSMIGILAAPAVISIFSPGLDAYRFTLATQMLRITFPYLMLISLAAFVGSILNSYGRFAIPAFTPALLNVCLIGTALFLGHWFQVPVESQAWGVLLAGIVQFVFQLPSLYRLGFLAWPKLSYQDPGVKKVLSLMLPAIFGASLSQISILLNTILASFLVTGSISWLYYSERLAYFPLGIFGVALATVILPHLSREHANSSKEGYSQALDWGIRLNLIIGLPATIAMLILSGPLIVCLFQYGKFSTYDLLMTQKSVITYAIGLQAFMLTKILSSAFYATQNIKTPVKVSMLALSLNMVFSLILVWPLAHAGLALASSLGSWINSFILIALLIKYKLFRPQPGWGLFVLQLLVACSFLALFLWYFSENTVQWIQWDAWSRFFHLFILGFSACFIYFGTLGLEIYGIKQIKHWFSNTIHS